MTHFVEGKIAAYELMWAEAARSVRARDLEAAQVLMLSIVRLGRAIERAHEDSHEAGPLVARADLADAVRQVEAAGPHQRDLWAELSAQVGRMHAITITFEDHATPATRPLMGA